MPVIKKYFHTESEANAFIAGVEYVNDSAIEGCLVRILGEDGAENSVVVEVEIDDDAAEESPINDLVFEAVSESFHARLKNSTIPSMAILLAVEDVFETSGVDDGEGFTDGDVELAVTRTILQALKDSY